MCFLVVVSVLVYSEFAGCSTDFKGALIINPYDSDKVAESINIALTMSDTTKQVGSLAGDDDDAQLSYAAPSHLV
jgi:hypothetical protein